MMGMITRYSYFGSFNSNLLLKIHLLELLMCIFSLLPSYRLFILKYLVNVINYSLQFEKVRHK